MKGGGIRQRLAKTGSLEDASSSSAKPSAEPPEGSAPGPRKGIKMRINDADATSSSPPQKAQKTEYTGFNDALVRQWSRGKLTSEQVLELAYKAARQGASGVGKLDKNPGPKNACRALLDALPRPDSAPSIDFIDIPGPDGVRAHPILCPIKTLERLWKFDRQRFNQVVTGPAGYRKAYWKGIQHTALFQRISHHICTAKHNALGFHGDGAPTSKTKNLFTIAFFSLHGVGTTRETRLVYTVADKNNLVDGALTALWQYFVWAMNTLLVGWADKDWKDRPIQRRKVDIGDNLFACVQSRGDWDFYRMPEVYNFEAWNSIGCCYVCGATLTGATHWLGQGWRGTIKTHESYTSDLQLAGVELPVLFLILTLCHEGVMPDVLHVVDQCIASHIIANVFIEIMALGHWGSNQGEHIEGLQDDLNDWYKDVGESSRIQGQLTFSRIRSSGDWPKLKAKAGATRHLAKYALYLCVKYHALQEEGPEVFKHSQRRKLVCELLVRFYIILETEGRFFSQKTKSELSKLGVSLFTVYKRLSEEALRAEKRAWKMTPKFHVFLHICEISSDMENPRFHWTYTDEDLQQVMKKIAVTCHAGHVEWLCLFKWLTEVYH